MRKIIGAALLLLSFTACASRTEYGSCVGINDKKNPKLEYKCSERNLILSILFAETFVVPVVVVFDELECPVGPAQ